MRIDPENILDILFRYIPKGVETDLYRKIAKIRLIDAEYAANLVNLIMWL